MKKKMINCDSCFFGHELFEQCKKYLQFLFPVSYKTCFKTFRTSKYILKKLKHMKIFLISSHRRGRGHPSVKNYTDFLK